MPKIVCVKCQTEFSSALGDVGVVVVEMAGDRVYKLWMADLASCSGCGTEVVGAFADNPLSRDEEAARQLEEIKRIGKARIIYDYERPIKEGG